MGPRFSVDPTHVDSNSAPQVDESFQDALENDSEKVQEDLVRRTMGHGGPVRSFVQ